MKAIKAIKAIKAVKPLALPALKTLIAPPATTKCTMRTFTTSRCKPSSWKSATTRWTV